MIICPTCKVSRTTEDWNKTTKSIVSLLTNSNSLITPIENRTEGALYRCPNPDCEDEVITNKFLELQTQE